MKPCFYCNSFRIKEGTREGKFKDETILLATDAKHPLDPAWARHAVTCRTKTVLENHVKVVLKGMCANSILDKEYILNWMPMANNPWEIPRYWYQGRRNSSIIYVGDGQWALNDGTEHFKWGKDQINSTLNT